MSSPSLPRRMMEGGRGSRAGSVDYDKAVAARTTPQQHRGSLSGGGGNSRVQQLKGEEPAALNFLARRGSEADNSASEVESTYEEEAMANAERELAADAEWKRIQQNTFTR